MASIRRLLPLITSSGNQIIRRPFLCSFFHDRAGGGVEFGRSFSAGVAPDVRPDGQHTSDAACSDHGDQIERIRLEYEEARRNFLNNPAALKNLPRMDPKGIYVNKNLKLEDIHVYGFDYDYTLAHYSENLQALIYDLAKEHLVNELRYPESCLDFKYDPTFPIRGLCYDRLKGCLLKTDFFGSIEPDGCYYGRRKLTMDEIRTMYGTRHIGRDSASLLVCLMDFFCFSEACLIADIVQHFVDAKLQFDACYIYEDVNHAIQHVHRSGLLHRSILSDPQRYLVKNRKMLQFLEKLKEKGKKLFLLTNSPFYFVDGGMRFMLEVIYFGDHLFSDLRGTSKARWRTAAIIHELENEIEIQNDENYRFQQAKFHIIQELLGELYATVPSHARGEAYHTLLKELDKEYHRARSIMRNMFSSSFGATFLTDTGQESAFAYNIHQYADVYTSKPENFMLHSDAWLHAPYDIKIMPHHVKVPSSVLRTKQP